MSFDTELSAALEAARLADDLIRREYESFVAVPDAPASISTHVDKASQDLILKFLHAKFPGDALCAEESIPGFEAVPKSGPRAWVVDPIDGTRGFAKKVGQFSVMIGLLVEEHLHQSLLVVLAESPSRAQHEALALLYRHHLMAGDVDSTGLAVVMDEHGSGGNVRAEHSSLPQGRL